MRAFLRLFLLLNLVRSGKSLAVTSKKILGNTISWREEISSIRSSSSSSSGLDEKSVVCSVPSLSSSITNDSTHDDFFLTSKVDDIPSEWNVSFKREDDLEQSSSTCHIHPELMMDFTMVTNTTFFPEEDVVHIETITNDDINLLRMENSTWIHDEPKVMTGKPLKVLFLSADTGGGHRASAESLAKQFQTHFPGSTYDLLDVWSMDGTPFYKTLVPAYKHLSAHPNQWRLFFHLSNNFLYEILYDRHSSWTCERRIRRRIASYKPDVIVSVHPTMNNVPLLATRRLSNDIGRYIPFFTVVTDFGSAHTTWFHGGVDKMFVASDRIRRLAKRRSRIRDENLVMSGLPIRQDFAIQSDAMGDRTSDSGKLYRKEVRRGLDLDANKPMVLVMGGGEGVGSLSSIVEAMYERFVWDKVDATICVVCGRNIKLKEELETKDWNRTLAQRAEQRKTSTLWNFLFGKKKGIIDEIQEENLIERGGNVDVVPLGFVTRMAEYMVSADVLVSKAGPGTIAEAAALGLPVMLTSFLPGQEAGNVDIVLDGGFGAFSKDPDGIALDVSKWLRDESILTEMSHRAKMVGHPNAASDIALDIGSMSHQHMAKKTNDVVVVSP